MCSNIHFCSCVFVFFLFYFGRKYTSIRAPRPVTRHLAHMSDGLCLGKSRAQEAQGYTTTTTLLHLGADHYQSGFINSWSFADSLQKVETSMGYNAYSFPVWVIRGETLMITCNPTSSLRRGACSSLAIGVLVRETPCMT